MLWGLQLNANAIVCKDTNNLLSYGYGNIDFHIDTQLLLNDVDCIGLKCFRESELKENGFIEFHRWNGGGFDLVQETSENVTSINGNVNEYATILATNGFTGDPQSITDIQAWYDLKLDECETWQELREVTKLLFHITGRSITALTYGWKL